MIPDPSSTGPSIGTGNAGSGKRSHRMRRQDEDTRMILIAAALAVALGPALALAGPDTDVGFRGWGPRVGLSLNPDQVHFGAHLDFGNFARHVRFQPNVELGFGDDVKLFTVNAEAAYRFSSHWDVWTPYLGGGLGANIKSVDNGGQQQLADRPGRQPARRDREGTLER